MKHQITIEIEAENALELETAKKSLQEFANRVKSKGINKLMGMYKQVTKKVLVEGFLKSNGI